MAHCLLALGSNLGDRAAQLRQAMAELARLPSTRIVAHSCWHETPPIGGPTGQGPFLNGAALVATSLASLDLLAELRRIEIILGRAREQRWAARSLDLDVLLYDAAVIHTGDLEIPHPRMAFRRFVLEPAAEIAAWMVHPPSGWTVGGLLRHLNCGADQVAVAAVDVALADKVIVNLADRLELSTTRVARSGRPVVARWAPSATGASAVRPKLLIAIDESAGIDARQAGRMLCLPSTGPIAWLTLESADDLHEALAAVQSVWPALVS